MLDRRNLLKSAALMPVAGVAAGLLSTDSVGAATRCIVDTRRPEAARFGEHLRYEGAALFDPRGEIVALLTDPAHDWLRSPGLTLGSTGYVDFALARDVLRHARRPVSHALALTGDNRELVLGSTDTAGAKVLFAWAERAAATARSTTFLWLA